MAPTVKTYGKKKTRKKIDKEDTFDRLFRPSGVLNIFEVSPNDVVDTSSAVKEVSPLSSEDTNNFSLERRLKDSQDISYITPHSVEKKRVLKKYANVSKVSKVTKNKSSIKLSQEIIDLTYKTADLTLFSTPNRTFCSAPKPRTYFTSISPICHVQKAACSPRLDCSQSDQSVCKPNLLLLQSVSRTCPSDVSKDVSALEKLNISNEGSINKSGSATSVSKSPQNLSPDVYKTCAGSKTGGKISSSPANSLTMQPVVGDLNVDSSDIEESAVNSADERSYSIQSGQVEDDESTFHSSDEENVSGFSKEKDPIDITNQKSSPKCDSESAIFSAPQKNSSCNQSGDVSADDFELYTESEIAKSSDSIEISRAANIENSDVSTSSDKDILKDDDINPLVSQTINLTDKVDSSRQNINYQNFRRYSVKSKDSSFYSVENSASDESEQSNYESDSEFSGESSRSSRKSSLESTITLPKEVLEQLRESVSRIRMHDEYEGSVCSKSRKSSLNKRSSEWECPPSPRRIPYPLAPLFPLPENQEDLVDESKQYYTSGSMCESTTASEEDSYQSNTRKSKGKLKESLFRKSEDYGMEGRSSGEDESTKSSPVRDSSRLRRSRRIAEKRESDCRLNMVIEESDSESTEADLVPQLEHIILPRGKIYRRSLSIIKHLGDESTHPAQRKGRHYDQSVEAVIKLQSKTGFLNVQDGRKSLVSKRKSLLGQCYTPFGTPRSICSRGSVDMFMSFASESIPFISRRSSFRDLSYMLKEESESLESSDRDTTLDQSIITNEKEGNESQSVFLGFDEPSIVIEQKQTPQEESIHSVNKLNEPSIVIEQRQTPQEESILSVNVSNEFLTNFANNDEAIVMKVCQQTEPYRFSDVLFGDCLEGSSKVGEGVFGEVFMVPRENSKNVVKIIPIEGNILVNQEKQKTYADIFNELFITIALSDLREEDEHFMTNGFAELIRCSIVKGRYPKKLLELWNNYDQEKGSDNDSPAIFGCDQLFLILELGHAGMDLESYSFSTARQGLSVFKQTVCALAVAEACAKFEHRDLHWGNVLVSRTSERKIPFVLNKETYTVLTNGVKATIIDFTLSRMDYSNVVVFYDLNQDPDMFIGTGDYQFDVYRHMKDYVQDDWNTFVPKTNVRWLHYLVDKMISMVRYQRKTAKVHKDSMKVLKDIESWILSCDNSVQVALRIVQEK